MLDSHRTHRRLKKQALSASSVRRPLLPAAGARCPFCKGETIPSGRSGIPCENCSYCPRCAMTLTEGEAGKKCRRCSFLLRAAVPFGDELGG